ncbi:MAG: VanZ family protein [Myxococcota bacterium]
MTSEPTATSRAAAGQEPAPGLRDPQLWLAWALLALFTAFVLLLGGERFSAASSYRWFAQMVQFFDPEASNSDILFFFSWVRKLAHALEYAVLALFAFRAARLSLAHPLGRVVLVAGLFTALVAGADEARQSTLGSRTGSVLDVWIDVVSAAVALGVLVLMRVRRVEGHPSPAS